MQRDQNLLINVYRWEWISRVLITDPLNMNLVVHVVLVQTAAEYHSLQMQKYCGTGLFPQPFCISWNLRISVVTHCLENVDAMSSLLSQSVLGKLWFVCQTVSPLFDVFLDPFFRRVAENFSIWPQKATIKNRNKN
jgi:hypothetical protein